MSLRVCRYYFHPYCTIGVQLRSATDAATNRLSFYRSKRVIDAYNQLELSPDEEIGPIEAREAFFRLAKRFHPDTGSTEADGRKFAAVKDAYQIVMESGTVEGVGTPNARPDGYQEMAREMNDVMEEFARKFDIRHTAPQHRQYLSFDGFGSGSPMERSRQYDNHRVEMAANKALEYRVEKIAWKDEKTAVVVEKKKTKDVKTRLGMERVVEDLIQESMRKGDFDVIKGKGKPLKSQQEVNPYSDFMTNKINEILINNGYQPEWVELGKEIRRDMLMARNRLVSARCSLVGRYPFEDVKEAKVWRVRVTHFETEWKPIVEKIKRFNLLVPTLNQQIIPTSVEKEVQKIINNHKDEEKDQITSTTTTTTTTTSTSSAAAAENGIVDRHRRNNNNNDYDNVNNDAHAHFRGTNIQGGVIDESPRRRGFLSIDETKDSEIDSPMELFKQMMNHLFRWKSKSN